MRDTDNSSLVLKGTIHKEDKFSLWKARHYIYRKIY